MNDELFIGLVKQLKNARDEQERLAAEKKEWEMTLAREPIYVATCEKLKEANEQVNSTTKMLKTQLINEPTYVPPFKAAWLIDSTEIVIDDEKALAWAKENMRAAVSEIVDKKMLTDFAKKNPGAAPYAVITDGKDARIASDLGKCLEMWER